jgi:Patatin-like phospholipase
MAVEPGGNNCPHVDGFPPRATDLVGLAFSGGGVRSATFSLGALQALHERNLLPIFDYLSTVSGGGFTGAWLSAWLARPNRTLADRFPQPEELEPARHPPQLTPAGGGPPSIPPGLPDGSRSARRHDPINHLRLFANYLTPRTGILSADTWRLITFCTVATTPMAFETAWQRERAMQRHSSRRRFRAGRRIRASWRGVATVMRGPQSLQPRESLERPSVACAR